MTKVILEVLLCALSLCPLAFVHGQCVVSNVLAGVAQDDIEAMMDRRRKRRSARTFYEPIGQRSEPNFESRQQNKNIQAQPANIQQTADMAGTGGKENRDLSGLNEAAFWDTYLEGQDSYPSSSEYPTPYPTDKVTGIPSKKPPTDTNVPTTEPTKVSVPPSTFPPSAIPVSPPTDVPTESPVAQTTSPVTPIADPTPAPAVQTSAPVAPIPDPTPAPVVPPTPAPTDSPTAATTIPPTPAPVVPPTPTPIDLPTQAPIPDPTPAPAVPPTLAPVVPPTPAPIDLPTPAPVVPPTPTPIDLPTPAPIPDPTPAPIAPPTLAPVVTPTPAPVVPPTPAPVVPPTPAPIDLPTPAPIPDPTPAPVVPPTPAPVVPPTPAPVVPPTPAPVVPPTPPPTDSPTTAPVAPTPAPIAGPPVVLQAIEPIALQGGSEFIDPCSYQSMALARTEEVSGINEQSPAKIIQYYVLYSIFMATSGVSNIVTESEGVVNVPGWIDSSGWDNTSSDPCSGGWFGVACEGDQVVSLDLFSNLLTGGFPPEVTLLASDGARSTGAGALTRIDLFDNRLLTNGGDNSWWSQLGSAFGELFFRDTAFFGPLGRLPVNIRQFDCSFSFINGGLTDENFDGLNDLVYAKFDGNSFNSPVPSAFSRLPNLQFLYFIDAFISGDLSYMIGMPSLIEHFVSFNPNLGGPIPSQLGSISTLKSLEATSCSFSGTLPTELGNLGSVIKTLWLYDNDLTGTIPPELGKMVGLSKLQLEGNAFTGTMPAEVCANAVFPRPLETLGADCFDENFSCDCCTCCSVQECPF